MQRHASILANNGFTVLLVGRELPASKPLGEFGFAQKRIKCKFNKGKLFYLEYNLRLIWFLIFCKPDIYLAVDLDTLLPNYLIAKARHKKLVFDSHEYFTEVPEVVDRPLTKHIWECVGSIAVSGADLAYTVGPTLAEIFTKKYGLKFYSILNVPALVRTETIEKPIGKVIFYQGALNIGRGLESLILAMRLVNGELWIAGEGDLSMALREMVKREKLDAKIKFLGFILPKDLPAYTQQARVACNLLEPMGLSYYYSLANKYFDYMHAGVPQICANFPEYKAINSEFEVAVLVSCIEEEIVLALNNLLEDSDLYERLQNNCSLASQVYNLQNESQKLVQLYQSL